MPSSDAFKAQKRIRMYKIFIKMIGQEITLMLCLG